MDSATRRRRNLLLPSALVSLLFLLTATTAHAGARYQWAVTVDRPDGKVTTAHLWIPPEARRVRGVIIGGGPSLEMIATDPAIREAAAAEELAIIAVSENFDSIFNYAESDAPRVFEEVLERAAETSGYQEIAVAPFFSFGHSVACNYATAVACWRPERCFGALLFKGGLVLPAYDPEADISGIPILAIKGQFEEFGGGPSGVLRDFETREAGWRGSRRRYLELRGENPRLLLSLLVEAGSTHMAWSPRDGEYAGLFIRKAARARIPDWSPDASEPVRCRPIDETRGALSTTAFENPGAPAAAPYADYGGKRESTYWHADLELAREWEAFHEGRFHKRAQFVAFTDPETGKTIHSLHDLRYRTKVQWTGPGTFRVAATFLEEHRPRDKYPVPSCPVGRADGPIRFRVYRGRGVEQVGEDTFRVVAGGPDGLRTAILAYHPGDDEFRHAEQPASVKLRALAEGKPQTIRFPPVGPLSPNGPAVELEAATESGLAVTYAVESGPAVIEDGKLKVVDIPPRAKLPLRIEVVACQWGSAVEPRVQTAEPVRRTIVVEGGEEERE